MLTLAPLRLLGMAMMLGTAAYAGVTAYAQMDPPIPEQPIAKPAEFLQLHDALEELIKASIPAEHANDRHWNQTTQVYAGVRLRRDDGGKLETQRRWKEVNHGSWYRSRIRLIDPHERLQIVAQPFVLDEAHRYKFDMAVLSDIAIWGQWAQWNYGVQLVSLSLDGDATVRVQVKGTVGFRLAGEGTIPDVIVDPHVDSVDIALHRFRIHHVSDVGGEVSQQLSKTMRKAIEEELAGAQQARIVEKLNTAIEKKRDRLRIRPSAWFQQWLTSQNL
jgi:hypothetical protein